VAALGVSKSSVSLWVRDMPRPPRLSYEETRKRAAEGARRYWAVERVAREARREEARAAAAAEMGGLSPREVLLIGAVAYWCEGAKSKPHNIHEHVCFVNSDPGLIRFFLVFLGKAGVEPAQLRFSVQVHESADVVRKNTGPDYHGCLRIDVLQSAGLYRRIEGWVRAATTVSVVTPARS